MARVVVVLLWQCDDQLKIWTSIDESPHHTISYRLNGESRMQVYEGWSPSYKLRDPRFWGAKH